MAGPKKEKMSHELAVEKILLPLIIRAHKSYQLGLIGREEAEALTGSVG